MFPCAIPHRRADYPRVTHPSATSDHPRVAIRPTCMLKTRRQRSFWARIELSVMESCTEVQAAFHSILPFILTNSASFQFSAFVQFSNWQELPCSYFFSLFPFACPVKIDLHSASPLTLHPFGRRCQYPSAQLGASGVIFRRLTYLTQLLAKCEGVF